MSKFTTSFGYDPFSKPMNLTWLETPTDISHADDAAAAQSLPLASQVLSAVNAGANVHVIMQNGKWYQIKSSSQANANLNSVVSITSVAGQTYTYGADFEFFGSVVGQDVAGNNLGKVFVGGDAGVRSANPDGSAEALVGNANYYITNVYRALKKFAAKLYFGNANTIGAIDSTGTVTSSVIGTGINAGIYSELNPPLEPNARVSDLEPSIANDYLLISTADLIQQERLDISGSDTTATLGGQHGTIYYWNAIDPTVTSAIAVPSYLVSSLLTYFKQNSFFAQDTFGAALNDGTGKILTLPNNKSPLPNSIAQNGNFVTFACAENDSTNRYVSLYYYGALDSENQPGLFRVLRWTSTQASGFVSKVPLNVVVANSYKTVTTAQTGLAQYGYGKHYIGLSSVNSSATQNFLLAFLITSTGTGTPQLGVYETQTQLFSKRTTIKQVRIYTEPTATNNGFQLDMIGSDGSIITNGTFNYTYAAGTDITKLQGALERINFNPAVKDIYALGLRITNTGTANMTIKKIEVDYEPSGQ